MLIGYIGISHLSLNYATASLLNGHEIIFIDNFEKIKNYKFNKLNIFEPKLDKIFNKYKKKIQFSDNFKLSNITDINFIALDIITDKKNKVDYRPLNKLLNKFLQFSFKKNALIIMSQVEVSFTRKLNYPSHLLYHYVETLIFGKAVERANNPERIIIGKYSSNQRLNKKFKKYLSEFNCPLIEMVYEESELTKGFINTYLASQLITTNNLNELAKFYNCDWGIIKKALQLDKRIGSFAYLEPGLGISGGNIERDLKTILDKKNSFGISNNYFKSLLGESLYFKNWIQTEIKKLKLQKPVIGLLGITYKEDSLSIKNSPSINFVEKNKNKIYLHDFQFKNIILEKKFSSKFRDLEFLLMKSNIIVLLHSNKFYLKLDFKKFKNIKAVLDPFNYIKNKGSLYQIKHISL